MKLLFLGDIAPDHYPWFFSASSAVDGIVANLETPYVASNILQKQYKSGPSLCFRHIPNDLNLWHFNIANNHMMDYGDFGLMETIQALRQNGAGCFGAGSNSISARSPIIISNSSESAVLISCCEQQFGSATSGSAGVATLGPWIYQAIRQEKQACQHVIISVHAGIEESPWPEPWRRDLYRSFIDAGADMVFGHHSHVPQGWEMWNRGIITYGSGNFIVNPLKWNRHEMHTTSVGFEIIFSPKYPPKVIPKYYRSILNDGILTAMEFASEDSDWFSNYLNDINSPIKNNELESLFQEVSMRLYHYRNSRNVGLGEGLDNGRGFPFPAFRYCKERLDAIMENRSLFPVISRKKYLRNYLFHICKSHNEAISSALGIKSGSISDLRNESTRSSCDKWLIL